MRRMIRMICLVLSMCLFLSIGASAESEIMPRANSYIAAHDTFLYKISSNQFQIWFDVTGNATDIDMIGVKKIEVYRSSDQTNWIRMRTYGYEYCPEMMDYNSGSHTGYVTYGYTTAGYYYKAYVTFYAANSTGSGTVHRYTTILQM